MPKNVLKLEENPGLNSGIDSRSGFKLIKYFCSKASHFLSLLTINSQNVNKRFECAIQMSYSNEIGFDSKMCQIELPCQRNE